MVTVNSENDVFAFFAHLKAFSLHPKQKIFFSIFARSGAGGVGEVMADWIIEGAPQGDLWSFDVRRFVGLHNNRMFLSERVKETLGLSYAIRYPDLQFESSRELLRTSPLYTRLEVEGLLLLLLFLNVVVVSKRGCCI